MQVKKVCKQCHRPFLAISNRQEYCCLRCRIRHLKLHPGPKRIMISPQFRSSTKRALKRIVKRILRQIQARKKATRYSSYKEFCAQRALKIKRARTLRRSKNAS